MTNQSLPHTQGASPISPDHMLPPRITDHLLLRPIGSGSYGEVWLAKSIIGTYRAIKVVYRRTFEQERPYEREFNGMKKFEPISRSHEGLVDILQVGRNDQDGYYYYVMELGDDQVTGPEIVPDAYAPKTLDREVTLRGRLPFQECLQIGLSLAAALGHLHKHGLIHRDIKPSNIIFVNGVPKVADIGLVAEMDTSRSFVGTEGFIPPEGPGTVQSDIYSLGKVLYEISTGRDRKQYPELPTRLDEIADQREFLELNEIILKACENDVHKRYQSADEMRADLLLLQAGKSVKRLRVLERRLALLTRIGVVAAVMMVIAGTLFYQAKRAAKRTTQALAGSYIAYGTRSVDEGDLIGSLPWFAQALLLEKGDLEREKRHRLHLSVALRQCPKLVQLWFQEGVINDAKFSPDGQHVITAGEDGKAMVRNLNGKDKRPRLVLEGHTSGVETATFSRDQRLIVTASTDKTARVWDAETGQLIISCAHDGKVYCAKFNSKADRIVTTCADTQSGDYRARVWEVATGKLLFEFSNHKDLIQYAAFSPDDRLIVIASNDYTVQVWDVETQKAVGPLLKHDDWVYQATFSPDGRYVVTASFDNSARVWDWRTGQYLTLEHAAAVRSAEFSPDGRYVVTACFDYTARVWDLSTRKEVTPPLKHNGDVMHASFSPDAHRVVTATKNGVTAVWDLSPSGSLPPAVRSAFSQLGNRYAIVRSNLVEVWNAGASNSAVRLIKVADPVSEMRFNRHGSYLAIISTSTSPAGLEAIEARLWDVATGDDRVLPFARDRLIKNFYLSDDGKRMMTVSSNLVQICDTLGGTLVSQLPHTGNVSCAAFNPIGSLAVTATGTNAHLWELPAGKMLHVLPHARQVSHVEFSPNGSRLVTACADTSLDALYAQVWDVATGSPIGQRLQHRDGVLRASFSPDGLRVITASEDRTAQIWLAETGERLRPRLVHKDEVHDASFSPDGRRVVTACKDGTVRLWDAATGEPLTPPLFNQWPKKVGVAAQFLANGQSIVAKRPGTGEARIWDLPPDFSRPVEDFVLLAQLLSGHQSDPTGGALPLTKESLLKIWDQLYSRYPDDFAASADEIRSWQEHEAAASLEWHIREAESCEKAEQWFAAAFHLDLLLTAEPNDSNYRNRLIRAQARLASRPEPLPPSSPAKE